MVSQVRSGTGERSSRSAPAGRYSGPKLAMALADVCAAAGLDPRGARLLRFVNNAVFRLREHPVVVRIVLAPSLAHRAGHVVAAARWLAEHDVPAVRLLPGVEQPVRVGEHVATLWEAVPEVGAATAEHLGGLLRRLHELPAPAVLPWWQPLRDVRRKFADAEELDPGDRRFLERHCADVEHRLEEMSLSLPWTVVHGDAHLGNVIAGPDGPVLCDLDSMCVGPPEWDLTPLAVGRLRMGHPAERYERFAAAYGRDVTTWPGFPVLRDLRELKIAVSALPILRSNPGVREQLRHRLRAIRERDFDTQWAPYG
ncbi:aminoglycoside phosphotransferase family protein [Saccharopolyspora cebuensis]|uniref:Phosphotransferase enzyme family protein n=1 Tax=Saccharopolyspora cebuensis TaxID=418759 RepID=A0ABV4CKW0_9PSEU